MSPKTTIPERTSGSGALLLAGVLLLPQLASGQADPARNSYFSDSAAERTPLVTAFPKYPSVARRDRIEGDATVCFTISASGRIERPTVRRYTHKIFRNPALRAARNSSFEPLRPGEARSPAKTCRTYRFRLEPIVVESEDN